MKTTIRLFPLSLMASLLGGCAADASTSAATAGEKTAVTHAADTAAYLQTFDPDFQSILFQPSAAIDGVILHVTIDGTRTSNVSMREVGTSAAAGPAYEIGSLPVVAGDSIVYSFTYSANGVAQDTPQFTYALPGTWVPTAFFTNVDNGAIEVTSTAPLSWVDVHYSVNGGTEQNVRLTPPASPASVYSRPVTLAAGDVLAYSVTYATSAATFDTATALYTAPAANLLAGPWQFVGSDLTPSTAYTIQGDTVDLDFQGYFSWSGTWASGYQGYTFAQPAAVTQGSTYILTVNVTDSNVGIPVVVKASLSGAGAEQEQQSMGNGVLTFTFPVATAPGSSPVLDLVAHPVLGQIGPVQGTGIGIQSYDLTASLVQQ